MTAKKVEFDDSWDDFQQPMLSLRSRNVHSKENSKKNPTASSTTRGRKSKNSKAAKRTYATRKNAETKSSSICPFLIRPVDELEAVTLSKSASEEGGVSQLLLGEVKGDDVVPLPTPSYSSSSSSSRVGEARNTTTTEGESEIVFDEQELSTLEKSVCCHDEKLCPSCKCIVSLTDFRSHLSSCLQRFSYGTSNGSSSDSRSRRSKVVKASSGGCKRKVEPDMEVALTLSRSLLETSKADRERKEDHLLSLGMPEVLVEERRMDPPPPQPPSVAAAEHSNWWQKRPKRSAKRGKKRRMCPLLLRTKEERHVLVTERAAFLLRHNETSLAAVDPRFAEKVDVGGSIPARWRPIFDKERTLWTLAGSDADRPLTDHFVPSLSKFVPPMSAPVGSLLKSFSQIPGRLNYTLMAEQKELSGGVESGESSTVRTEMDCNSTQAVLAELMGSQSSLDLSWSEDEESYQDHCSPEMSFGCEEVPGDGRQDEPLQRCSIEEPEAEIAVGPGPFEGLHRVVGETADSVLHASSSISLSNSFKRSPRGPVADQDDDERGGEFKTVEFISKGGEDDEEKRGTKELVALSGEEELLLPSSPPFNSEEKPFVNVVQRRKRRREEDLEPLEISSRVESGECFYIREVSPVISAPLVSDGTTTRVPSAVAVWSENADGRDLAKKSDDHHSIGSICTSRFLHPARDYDGFNRRSKAADRPRLVSPVPVVFPDSPLRVNDDVVYVEGGRLPETSRLSSKSLSQSSKSNKFKRILPRNQGDEERESELARCKLASISRQLSAGWQKILETGEKSDVALITLPGVIRVHSLVLLVRCPALLSEIIDEDVKTRFSRINCGEQKNLRGLKIIDWSVVPRDVAFSFLQYLYGGICHVKFQEDASWWALFDLSLKYKCADLTEFLELLYNSSTAATATPTRESFVETENVLSKDEDQVCEIQPENAPFVCESWKPGMLEEPLRSGSPLIMDPPDLKSKAVSQDSASVSSVANSTKSSFSYQSDHDCLFEQKLESSKDSFVSIGITDTSQLPDVLDNRMGGFHFAVNSKEQLRDEISKIIDNGIRDVCPSERDRRHTQAPQTLLDDKHGEMDTWVLSERCGKNVPIVESGTEENSHENNVHHSSKEYQMQTNKHISFPMDHETTQNDGSRFGKDWSSAFPPSRSSIDERCLTLLPDEQVDLYIPSQQQLKTPKRAAAMADSSNLSSDSVTVKCGHPKRASLGLNVDSLFDSEGECDLPLYERIVRKEPKIANDASGKVVHLRSRDDDDAAASTTKQTLPTADLHRMNSPSHLHVTREVYSETVKFVQPFHQPKSLVLKNTRREEGEGGGSSTPSSTPTSLKGNRITKHNLTLTPLPEYQSMPSPELMRELAQFGIRKLSRRKAVKLLLHIYEKTHSLPDAYPLPCLGDSSTPSVDSSRHSKKNRELTRPPPNDSSEPVVSSSSSSSLRSSSQHHCDAPSESRVANRCEFSPRKSGPSSVIELPEADDDERDNEASSHESSFNSEFDCPEGEDGFFDDNDEICVTQSGGSSSPRSSTSSLDSQLARFVRDNPSWRRKILLYEPIWAHEFLEAVKTRGNIRCSLARVTQFLDRKCVTFRLPSNRAPAMKGRRKKRS